MEEIKLVNSAYVMCDSCAGLLVVSKELPDGIVELVHQNKRAKCRKRLVKFEVHSEDIHTRVISAWVKR